MYFAHPIDFFGLPNLIRAILEQSINNKMVSKI